MKTVYTMIAVAILGSVLSLSAHAGNGGVGTAVYPKDCMADAVAMAQAHESIIGLTQLILADSACLGGKCLESDNDLNQEISEAKKEIQQQQELRNKAACANHEINNEEGN